MRYTRMCLLPVDQGHAEGKDTGVGRVLISAVLYLLRNLGLMHGGSSVGLDCCLG